MRLPSASQLTRAIHCPPSCVIPGNYFTTAWGEHGTGMHDFLRDASVIGRDDALRLVTDEGVRRAAEKLDTSILPKGGLHEVAYAWDHQTDRARVLGVNIGRRYVEHGLTTSEYPGSADFAGVQFDVAVVVDYKSGWYTEPARDSWQLRHLGLCAALVNGAPRARVAHLRMPDGAEPWWDIVELDEIHLAETKDRLRRLVDMIAHAEALHLRRGEVEVSSGAWCRYCPAFDRCPGKTALARAMLPAMEAVGPDVVALSVGDIALLAQKILRYDEIRDRVWSFIEAYAERDPVPLGDGRVIARAMGRASDRVLAPHKALRVLASMFDESTAERATSTTKGLIEDAVREWAKENAKPIGKTQDLAIEAIRKSGAIASVPGEEKVRIVKALGARR